MGYNRALKAINLEPSDKILLLGTPSTKSIDELAGVKGTETEEEQLVKRAKVLDMDYTYIQGRKRDAKGTWLPPARAPRETEYGTFEDFKEGFAWTETWELAYKGCKLARSTSCDVLWVIERPFKTYEQLLTYLERYDPRDDEQRSLKELTRHYKECLEYQQNLLGDLALVGGGIYLTLWTFFLVHLGHTFTVRLAFQNPVEFRELLDKYSDVAKMHVEAWSRTGIKVLMSHDDVATQLGPMIPPKWFRDNLAPYYKKIWAPVLNKGIKVVFYGDGDFTSLIDAVLDAGAFGFMIQYDPKLPHEKIEFLVNKYGRSHFMATGPNYDIMNEGGVEEAKSEALWFSSLQKKGPAFFLQWITGTTQNVEAFLQTWLQNRIRNSTP